MLHKEKRSSAKPHRQTAARRSSCTAQHHAEPVQHLSREQPCSLCLIALILFVLMYLFLPSAPQLSSISHCCFSKKHPGNSDEIPAAAALPRRGEAKKGLMLINYHHGSINARRRETTSKAPCHHVFFKLPKISANQSGNENVAGGEVSVQLFTSNKAGASGWGCCSHRGFPRTQGCLKQWEMAPGGGSAPFGAFPGGLAVCCSPILTGCGAAHRGAAGAPPHCCSVHRSVVEQDAAGRCGAAAAAAAGWPSCSGGGRSGRIRAGQVHAAHGEGAPGTPVSGRQRAVPR